MNCAHRLHRTLGATPFTGMTGLNRPKLGQRGNAELSHRHLKFLGKHVDRVLGAAISQRRHPG
jgi:hypothetical protein